jgi:large subunit ribosomal protein L14e
LCRRKLKEAWDAEGTMAAWEESSWAKKRKRHSTRKNLTDFQRFEAMLARKERSAARAKKM